MKYIHSVCWNDIHDFLELPSYNLSGRLNQALTAFNLSLPIDSCINYCGTTVRFVDFYRPILDLITDFCV